VTAQAEARREADTYKIEKVGKGQAAFSAATQRAEQLRGELAASYAAKKAEIDAYRTQPVEKVMERLGERLEGVTIEIQPWASDATPSRVQVERAGVANE
jgi:membrane protease subunit HflC